MGEADDAALGVAEGAVVQERVFGANDVVACCFLRGGESEVLRRRKNLAKRRSVASTCVGGAALFGMCFFAHDGGVLATVQAALRICLSRFAGRRVWASIRVKNSARFQWTGAKRAQWLVRQIALK